MSIVVHVLLIGGAVVATASAGITDDHDDLHERAVYVEPAPKDVPPERTQHVAPSDRHTLAGPVGAPSLPDVASIPIAIPPAGAALDPLRGLEASFDRGLRGGSGSGSDAGSAPSGDAPWDASVVDRAVVPLGTVRPHYPDAMRAMGRSGRAVVRFVVDTLGRVERDGIMLVTATDPAFGDAALRAVPGLRFRPAEARGRKVRQLVELPFDFVLQ